MQGDDLAPPAHTDDALASPSQAASRAPSSSRVTPHSGATVVPLDRIQKLEAQMATLLHHVKPWMQKSIAESEARMERRMVTMMDQKVQAVHKCLDAFELRVLEQPSLATDLSSFRTELDSLRADVDAIISTPTDEPESAPTPLADDTVLDALFSDDIAQPEPTRARGKRHRSSHVSDTTEDARARKRERQQNEQVRRASIVDEKLRQHRARESIIRASSSTPTTEAMPIMGDDVSTTNGAFRVTTSTTDYAEIDVRTTEGDPSSLFQRAPRNRTYPLVDNSSALCTTVFWPRSLLGHVHLNLGQKPKLRMANAKSDLNFSPDPTSAIVHLN
uniref:Integrase core domain containing protein n=1 Tax=Solanum tuberosum TaxID=4113 RepID=M1DL50_SOLTU